MLKLFNFLSSYGRCGRTSLVVNFILNANSVLEAVFDLHKFEYRNSNSSPVEIFPLVFSFTFRLSVRTAREYRYCDNVFDYCEILI